MDASEPSHSTNPANLSGNIRIRLRQFIDSSDEFRAWLSKADIASEKSKREIVDRLRRSANFERWKTEMLRIELENVQSNEHEAWDHDDDEEWDRLDERWAYAESRFSNEEGEEEDEQQHLMNSELSLALSGSSFVLMGKDYLKHAIDTLMDPDSNNARLQDELTSRYSTIQMLTHLPACDLCESDYWPDLKAAVRVLLREDRSNSYKDFCDIVLAFLIKLFNSSNHTAAMDSFVLLIDHLKEDSFQSRRIQFRINNDRQLVFEDPTDAYILRKMKIVNEMCLGFGRSLPRYSAQNRLEIMEKMIWLLQINPEHDSILTPFLATAILDPTVKWWRCWMHCKLGREAVLAALNRYWHLVQFLFQICPMMNSTESDWTFHRITTAERMLEDLIFHEESRLLLTQRIPQFPHEFLDQLLADATGDGKRGKFAWKIYFSLASSTEGRRLLMDKDRFGKICARLVAKENGYQIKIKFLGLLARLLTVDYSASCSVATLLQRDADWKTMEQSNYGQLIMLNASSFVTAACSRDPDAPLSLAHACFSLCTVLCQTWRGRRLVAQYEDLSICGMKLVKEHSIDIQSLLPILTSVHFDNPECDQRLRKFLSCNLVRDLWSPTGNGPSILWYRPLEVAEWAVQGLATYLTDLKLLVSLQDLESVRSYKQYFHRFIRLLFLILSHSNGSKLLLANDAFTRSLVQPFQLDQFEENAANLITLRALDFALSYPHFLCGLNEKWSAKKSISDLLKKYYCLDSMDELDDLEEGRPVECLIQNDFSIQLVKLYRKLHSLGNFNEPLMDAVQFELTPLDDILQNPFKFEPASSRRPIGFGAERLQEETLLDIFISHISNGHQIPYSEFLMESVKDVQREVLNTKSLIDPAWSVPSYYDHAIQYGVYLGLIDPDTAIAQLPLFLHGLRSIKISSEIETDVDWFAIINFLIFNANHERSLEFLQKFVQLESNLLSCVWPKMNSAIDFSVSIVSDLMPLVDTIMETELPRLIAVFTMNGVTASNLVIFWLHQCFVNVLHWTEICNYIVLSIMGGKRYQAFFVCCVLHQLDQEINRTISNRKDQCDFYLFLVRPVQFHFHRSFPFFLHLTRMY